MTKSPPESRRRAFLPFQAAVKAVAEPAVEESKRPLARLRLSWPELCGTTLAKHSEPRAIEGGVLIIGVHSRDWAQGVEEVQNTLLSAIRSRFPFILELSILVRAPEDTSRRPALPSVPNKHHSENASIRHSGLRDACDVLATLRDSDQKDSTGSEGPP